MKKSFVLKTANRFFENKKAIALCELKNVGNQIIPVNTEVIITGKSFRDKGCLNIRFNSIVIKGIEPESLQLVKEKEPEYWPIENDTLDLINHEFNFNK